MLISKNKFKEFSQKALPLAIAAALGTGFYQAPANAALPASAACSSASGAATCNLWAKAGTVSLPGAALTTVSVPTWGYTDTAGGAVNPGGPVLVVNQGDVVTVTLNNTLPEATALLFQGQSMPPDTVGAPAGTIAVPGTKTYTFTATTPGTYLYEAGLLANKQHQPAMGLYGALVVRPTVSATQAYTDASTAFNDEALVLVSEIDPLLNNRALPTSSVPPATFDMRKFAPRYFLINGKVHPNTDLISVPEPGTAAFPATGFNLLLRYVNAGVRHHSMATLGLRQKFIANDGSVITHPRDGVSETMGPGQTLDAITTVPATAASGSKFAVYDAGMHLNNTNSTAGMGGMLTFVALAGTAPTPGNPPATPGAPADTVGPVTSGVSMALNPTNGVAPVTLTATGNDTATGNSNIASATFSIAGGPTNQAMTLVGGATPVRNLTAVISPAAIALLSEGAHAVTVTSTDSATVPNTGAASAPVNLVVDRVAPVVGVITATHNPTNGVIGVNSSTAAVRVSVPLSDLTTTVAAGELFIDPVGIPTPGTGIILIPSDGSFNSTSETGRTDIPLSTILVLSNGNHTLSVRGKDAAGNWSALSTATLVVDKVLPTIATATLTPNSGTVALGGADPITLTVNASDVGTGLNGAQYTIDGGAAIPFALPSVAINTTTLTAGTHVISVRVKDSAGNFSAATPVSLYVVSAVNDTRSITANTSATQNSTNDSNTANIVLTNDQPTGVAERTVRLASAPVRTSGIGLGTIALSCNGGTSATPSISGNTICTNGSYRVTLTGVGATNNARQASKRGTYQFTYTEILNSITSNATVTITVN
jgi:Multicopper oxidase